MMFIANDIIWVGKDSTCRIRDRILHETGVSPCNILVSATHTHSGPMTLDYLSNEADPVVPRTDGDYVRYLEDAIISAAVLACRRAEPAEAGLVTADGRGVGTNRRDPRGPTDPEVPVLMVRSVPGGRPLACMLICSMHPTVLHEDSRLISADFPGMAKQYLSREQFGPGCPILYHTGPAGNQSPRHVTSGNTFDEAIRLGEMLGRAIAAALPQIRYSDELGLVCCRSFVDLPRRSMPTVAEAQENRSRAWERLQFLRSTRAALQEVRTVEVDWFGSEETLTLAQAAASGRLDEAIRSCLPAEIQVLRIGPWAFVGWQGEVFVEYALALKNNARNTYVISLANGELQGYIVTKEAASECSYEAGNALFDYSSGDILVNETLRLLARCGN
jgi:hypothetical protein